MRNTNFTGSGTSLSDGIGMNDNQANYDRFNTFFDHKVINGLSMVFENTIFTVNYIQSL